MKYLQKECLGKHSFIRIGGPADLLCVPRSAEEIKEALKFAKKHRLPLAIMGAGTNLLVLDQGFKGLVIKTACGLNRITIEKNRVQVGAGVLLTRLIRYLAGKGWGNLEFLAGIPGTIGGAVVMNAGAWGKDIAKYVEELKVLDREGKEKVLTKKDFKFGYRNSSLQGSPWVLTEITLKVRKNKKKNIQKKIEDHLSKRKQSQPLGVPNCGCIFKNPKNDFAGRLIESAGCKGKRVGDAQVSCRHANFIVNLGEARARDVIRLMTQVQKAVKAQHKILLEPEIKIMVKSSS